MADETIMTLKYNGFCSRCQERTGPFLYKVIDEINPAESGNYEFFGTIVKPDFVMINNTRFNTRKAGNIRNCIIDTLQEKIMFTKELKISIDNTNYKWDFNNQPAECLVLEFTFNEADFKDTFGEDAKPVKFIFGNDSQIEISPIEKNIVDKYGVIVGSIKYGYTLPSRPYSEDEPLELTDEMLEQILVENKSTNRERNMRNNRLI